MNRIHYSKYAWFHLLLLLFVTHAKASFDLKTSGYFRHGFLTDLTSGDSMECGRANNAYAKPRLGNECEGFLEFQLQPSYSSNGFTISGVIGWDYLDPPGGKPILLGADEKYIQVTTPSGWGGWAGKISYQRKEAHLYDYKYYHLRGEGVGGFIDLSETLHFSGAYFYKDGRGTGVNAFDMRLLISDLNDNFHSSTLEIIASYGEDRQQGANTALGMVLTTEIEKGFTNILSLKKADGPFAIHELTQIDQVAPIDSGLQFINELIIDKPKWSFGFTTIYEERITQEILPVRNKWFALAVRAMNHLNHRFSLVQEISYDVMKSNQVLSGRLKKYTAALQYAKSPSFYDRPVYRTFVTMAGRDDNANQSVDVINIGFQFETWW